jgi:hypothetical protein
MVQFHIQFSLMHSAKTKTANDSIEKLQRGAICNVQYPPPLKKFASLRRTATLNQQRP